MYISETISAAKTSWDEGTVMMVEGIEGDFTKGQYWMDVIALMFAELSWILWPLIFAFAARVSLLNEYFGVKFGTMVKWHRYESAMPISAGCGRPALVGYLFLFECVRSGLPALVSCCQLNHHVSSSQQL